jgi:hypothetical protein
MRRQYGAPASGMPADLFESHARLRLDLRKKLHTAAREISDLRKFRILAEFTDTRNGIQFQAAIFAFRFIWQLCARLPGLRKDWQF